MKKKEYISPESTVVLLDSSVLDTIDDGSDNDLKPDAKGTYWQEPDYDDDDGFGW